MLLPTMSIINWCALRPEMAENSDRIMADQIPSPGREPGLTLEEWRGAPRLLTGDARHLPQVDILAVNDQSRRIAHQAGTRRASLTMPVNVLPSSSSALIHFPTVHLETERQPSAQRPARPAGTRERAERA